MDKNGWIMMSNVNSPRSQQKFKLHPLIHTFPQANSPQNMGVGCQKQKCGLKYVIHISRGSVFTSFEHTYGKQWNHAGMISIS